MKKYVVIENMGTWEKASDKRMIIDCTVKETKIIAQSDDWETLFHAYGKRSVEYADSGKWYSYDVVMRKHAKMMMLK